MEQVKRQVYRECGKKAVFTVYFCEIRLMTTNEATVVSGSGAGKVVVSTIPDHGESAVP